MGEEWIISTIPIQSLITMGSSRYPEPIVNYAGLLNEKLVSGEPYAGEPHVRFGGRGDQ